MDNMDAVHIWHRAGNPTPVDRLSLYADALATECPIGPYWTLNDHHTLLRGGTNRV